MHSISEELRQHYSEKFSSHGPSSEGVDWGADETKLRLRYDKMLSVLTGSGGERPSLLDVGCGYGGLQTFALSKKVLLDYTGIDVAQNMIEWARANVPSGNFIQGDVLEYRFDRQFDYVVCNGILTQKLETPGLEMDRFAAQLIRQMFALCRRGIAFNIMTTKVNFYANNLYYRNPAEMLSWCLSEISSHLKLDHAYPLYEYTIYLYRDAV
jgi:2-polyprenyl-3-methyl-5-hydroxy-6-metoxy-1,4-benzoquinol methylase